VKHPKCIGFDGTPCSFEPTACYGVPGQKAIHCSTHKTPGEILNPSKKCLTRNCRNTATHGYSVPIHCEQHRSGQEINLVLKLCIGCQLLDVVDDKGYCMTCDPKSWNIIRLAKQKVVRDFFNFHHMNYESYDRMLEHGCCGKERPDFIFDCDDHKIVVEVDEHQHEGHGYECERERMINISQLLGGMPVIFIRYNPDKYKPIVGRATPKAQDRLENLKKIVEYWQQTQLLPEDGFCCATYMYYDGDDPSQWKTPLCLLTSQMVVNR
jgi:hypothetical protein